MANLYIVSSCEKGHYRTYRAAESLYNHVRELGHKADVETQGHEDDLITNTDAIANADVIIISTTKPIRGSERFDGKPVVEVHPETAIQNPASVLGRALAKLFVV